MLFVANIVEKIDLEAANNDFSLRTIKLVELLLN
jgi:hypothetical protein